MIKLPAYRCIVTMLLSTMHASYLLAIEVGCVPASLKLRLLNLNELKQLVLNPSLAWPLPLLYTVPPDATCLLYHKYASGTGSYLFRFDHIGSLRGSPLLGSPAVQQTTNPADASRAEVWNTSGTSCRTGRSERRPHRAPRLDNPANPAILVEREGHLSERLR